MLAHDVAPGTWELPASTTLGYTTEWIDGRGSSSALWLDTEALSHVATNVGVGIGASATRSSHDVSYQVLALPRPVQAAAGARPG